MIIRGVAGVVIGIVYGCLVGVAVFLLVRPDLQQHGSGLILIDPVAMGWFLVGGAAVVAGTTAGLAGLIVGLARLSKGKAAAIGFLIGLLPLVLTYVAFGPPGVPNSVPDWMDLFVTTAIQPVGVAFTAIVVAIVVHRCQRGGLSSYGASSSSSPSSSSSADFRL